MYPILVIGANGQIGTDLSKRLIDIYGIDQIILSDIRLPKSKLANSQFELLDILDLDALESIIHAYKIKTVINLAAVLSAKGENNPDLTWKINVDGVRNLLNLSIKYNFKIFQPSSIAVFGPDTPKLDVKQDAPLHPTTLYGVTKVAGEVLCNYYALKHDVDVRSVRFPGVIGGHSMPGGGTTDYAVEIFHSAIQGQEYNCYLHSDTALPMIYMDDALEAILNILSAPRENITIRTSYNINSLTFTPAQLFSAIKKYIPAFSINYIPDHRQDIAASWPASLDDKPARSDWGWNPAMNLISTTKEMLEILNKKYKK